MRKLIKPIFWTALFLVMMLAIDQFFVQVPPAHPAHAAVTTFYRDFRSRVIDLILSEKKAPKTIEAVIDKQQNKKQAPPKAKDKPEAKPQAAPVKPTEETTQRYLYSDGEGELHFADSLDDVPDEYRGQAQPMSR